MVILMIGTGIFLTFLTKGVIFTKFNVVMRYTTKTLFRKVDKSQMEEGAITPFQAVCTALAATIGVGNIAGVAAAITGGGPGAVFWMWLAAFFGMMTNFSENVLGIYYRRKNSKGEWAGGAMYYLRDGLGKRYGKKWLSPIAKVLAALFACFAILASFGIGNMSQVNSMVSNVENSFGIPTIVTGIFLVIAVGAVVLGGLQTIAKVTEKIVPFMVVLYFIGALIIIISNISNIPAVFVSIFKGAFAMKSVAGGIVGAGIAEAMKWGMKRGVFSNEAGLGSSVMVHSNSNVKEPVRQGMWGIFEVFADTIVVCTLTALTILASGGVDLQTGAVIADVESSALTSYSFAQTFGVVGSSFIAIAILLFAYSTVLGWSHYGSKACEYLFGTKAVNVYRVIFVIIVFAGSVMKAQLAWDLSDTFNGLMMIPNLIGVLVLAPLVFKCTKNYCDRHFRHLDVEPMLSVYPDIQEEHAEAVKKGSE